MLQAEMQQRVNDAVTESEVKARVLQDASEKNVHFSARVVALNSRLQNLQKQLRESQAREQALIADLELARQTAATKPAGLRTGLLNGMQRVYGRIWQPRLLLLLLLEVR